MLKQAARVFIGVLSGVGVLSIAIFIWLVSGGMSARRTPTAAEAWVGARMRSLAIPASDRQMRNPAPPGTGALKSAMEQFADHCAVCHANDGSGQADVGRGLYPRPPDMRSGVTQSMTDGEIFHIINDGVRFTGMPAWNQEASQTWALVGFIRHLPELSKAELDQMRGLNPRSTRGAGDRRSR
jgi:mono/diheme cytochrome c family protein